MRGASNANSASVSAWVEQAIGAPILYPPQTLATLWAGYGKIVRFAARDDSRRFILKQIRFPSEAQSDRGHARKVESYQVERTFYERFARYSCERARSPRLCKAEHSAGELWLLLEDLDEAGYDARPRPGSRELVRAGIEWLARFHAAHLGRAPEGLWAEGGYWHLGTRPDELGAIQNHSLYALAGELDARLRLAKFRTLIHGDPKLENFCATRGVNVELAAVDFQYVGGGVGVKDLVYFIGSAVPSTRVEAELPALVDEYFDVLRRECGAHATWMEFELLEAEWRELVPIAWLDFHRFLLGWSPSWAESDLYAKLLLAERVSRGSCR